MYSSKSRKGNFKKKIYLKKYKIEQLLELLKYLYFVDLKT